MPQITDRSHRSCVHAFGGEPPAQAGDGGAVVGVAAEHLRHQRRLVRDDYQWRYMKRARAALSVADIDSARRVGVDGEARMPRNRR
jgi:hypothetical protein